jgi:hypothetical protein
MSQPEHRSIVISLIWDIVLNSTISVACYFLSKSLLSPSELVALTSAMLFPILKSAYDLIRRHEIDPVTILVLLGIVTSILALLLGGNTHLLLIRESFFTGAFGIACLISLMFPRPIMFYFGRYFKTKDNPQKRVEFDAGWDNPIVRRTHRYITAVWGLVYVGEFSIRVLFVYTLPIPVVLMVSPFLVGIITIFTIIWTFRYVRKVRERFAISQVSTN